MPAAFDPAPHDPLGVTTRQREILRYIAGYQAARGGISPSHKEIGAALGFASTSIVNRLLVGLEQTGMIHRLRQRERAIRVLEPVTIPRAPATPEEPWGAPLYFVPLDRAELIAARSLTPAEPASRSEAIGHEGHAAS
ncbi:MAG: hypothetical protein U0975_16225 [Erythrobacter sp.]|nr:hypothetical protein [Erythrobacter sp.]MDZ4274208.1 hypothetical protein [Erythrobacter sp.]